MRHGEDAPAGEEVDAAPMPAGEQREDHVHRGERRAEEEDLGVRSRPARRGLPRACARPAGEEGRSSPEEARAGSCRARAPRRGRGGAAGRELDASPGPSGARRGPVHHPFARREPGGAEQLAEVRAVEAALEERLGVGRLAAGREPAEEVRRLIGEALIRAAGTLRRCLRLLGRSRPRRGRRRRWCRRA
jgi:hypothetical protein